MTIESLLQLFNHCGTFAFATSGVRLTEHLNRQQKNLLTAFLSAFGGGLTRDLILLHRKPALFDSQVDILITLLVFLLYVVLQRFQVIQFLDSRPIKMLLLLFDAAGTSVFICAGVEAAISCNTGTGVILLSGVLTAIGGGIWAAFVAGQSPKTILQNAIGYRVIVLCHSAAYTFGHLIFQKNTEILDISLVAVCTTCCYIRYRILETQYKISRRVFSKIIGILLKKSSFYSPALSFFGVLLIQCKEQGLIGYLEAQEENA